jgi:formylglycine-generating enzyme required for sulfatase activity
MRPAALQALGFAAAGSLCLGHAAVAEGPAGPPPPPLPAGVFRDCPDCPQMVLVPPGEFTMGSPPGERFRAAEAPRRVKIAQPFAVGRFEVTFAEWEACVAGGGCGGHRPDDHGWGGGDQPVVGVTWDDAMAYVGWLSQKTGRRYRLLSEAEWEYAARAGTESAFGFGEALSSDQANFDASEATPLSPKGQARGRTTRVGSFPANAFGLHDMHGNAWEWTADCWNDDYTGAPSDGSPWLSGDCTGRVLRGGSWEDYVGEARSAARVASHTGESTWSDGLRVAREP